MKQCTCSHTDYLGNLILKDGEPQMYRFAGGYASFDADTIDGYHYYIADYLGNNRMVVNASTDEVEHVNHYYPYGGLIGDLCTGQSEQEFKFGDKKLDRTYGLDLYDFEARQYDAIAPWFTSIDPLAEKYYSISPYAYCAGDPVNLVDPTGMYTYKVNNGTGAITRTGEETGPNILVGVNTNGKETSKNLNKEQASMLNGIVDSQKKVGTKEGTINEANSSSISKEDALDLFKKLADFSNVEWSLSKGNDGKYTMRTNHDIGKVASPDFGTYKWMIHSHPGDSGFEGTKGASGDTGLASDGTIVYTNGDMNNVKLNTITWVTTWKKSHDTFPMHYVYHKKTETTYFYNAYKNNFRCNLSDVGTFRKTGKQ